MHKARSALMQGDLRQAIHYSKQVAKPEHQALLRQWLQQAEQRLQQEQQLELLETYTDQLVSKIK